MSFLIELIQSILLIISAILIIFSAFGLIKLGNKMENVLYARIHVIGLFDIACVIGLLGLGQYLLAGIYFIIMPFTSHAMANAFFKGEDQVNNEDLIEETNDKLEYMHPKNEVDVLDKENFDLKNNSDYEISFSKLEIIEDD